MLSVCENVPAHHVLSLLQVVGHMANTAQGHVAAPGRLQLSVVQSL